MKTSILASFLLIMTFMWSPPETGNPPVGYVVSLTDRFGQVVETATVIENRYVTIYEGTLLLSVEAIDEAGGTSDPSEWSDYQLSDREKEYLRTHSDKLGVPLLNFISQYIQTMYLIWEDPNEGD